MMRRLSVICGMVILALVWSGLLTPVVGHSFTGHMTMHVGVVALAAPLIAAGLARSRLDPSARHPLLFAALAASLLEFAVVWGWHAPVLHAFARTSVLGLVLEQGSFLAVGLILWISCIGAAAQDGSRRAAGVFGLLFTSMHMTLLGALLALAPRPLYSHGMRDAYVWGMSAIEDQNLGGVVMLAVGGAVYLLGGLVLTARLVNAGPVETLQRRENGERCASS
jgi:putative membrane protein